jgi:hypothetical protein
MNKTELLIAQAIGNAKLEGMSVSKATINKIRILVDPRLSSKERQTMADKYEQELINKYKQK